MKKNELVKAVAEKATEKVTTKQVDAVLEAFTSVVIDEVARGGEINMIGFGKFHCVTTPARMVRNPKTGESKMKGASAKPKFKPSATFNGFVKSIAR